MTKDQAISRLTGLKFHSDYHYPVWPNLTDSEALTMAIKALGGDLVAVTRCKDCFHFAPGTEKFDAFCVHNSVPVDEDGMGFCSEGVNKTEILDDPMEGAEHEID